MDSKLESGSSTANIYIPEEWSEAADSIAYDSVTSPPPIAFICGAKNSGKTTFSRLLLNILLQRYQKVAYLDADVGQPEFTAPGFLSLTVVDKLTADLAIPCLKTPERCFFFGDISSKRDPSAYLKYAFTLYDYYRKEYCTFDESELAGRTELPLVVNTPGWVKGIGYEILVDMLKYISPTHVVKINISVGSKNLPGGAFWLDGDSDGMVNIIEIKSACQDSLNRSVLVQKDARLLRDLRIMAYFRQIFPNDKPITTIKELAYALTSHFPYEVPISSIKIRHLHCQVPSTEIFYSLNATIVGLAVSSEESESLPWCVGLGIVRGIDMFKGLLYMITPVPQSTLEKVNLLLQGYIQIPTCLLQVKGCRSPYVSSNVLPTS
ncbi:hypothetical protein QUC31_006154 [Theobroma cacao]|uniref:Polynucleotide 5'-hydroxyl-kinase NOL9 isoform X1 n=2 Tax=Theobroma cacao TaxID=3641 RepID=A0AB32UMJ7_THECC|nr:PREDICTED: polynucleotide 5'-hydroxyl-kinase NOL9 isoform X1 [Theobroma cacao]EOY19330.1 Pre-mRNA cleavage complex II protein family isoform 1 [Theobroma cacao]